jgi:hypothetical protein
MIAFAHQCGTINANNQRRCTGCDQPLMPPVPGALRDLTAEFEKATGLDRTPRTGLAGLTWEAYQAGWDAAMDAIRPAKQVTP